jgi:branched-chain amino acid transport system ATP-binding protein
MAEPLLEVEGVETYYGNIRALNGVDVEVIRARSSR